jgi:NAD(P)H-hydrate epimerase
MCRAGQATFEAGLARFTQARHWLVLCGAGNNAGDGYVIARLARAAGCEVTAVAVADPLRLKGDARKAFEAFRAAGGETQAYDPVNCPAGDLIVDALLGTGLDRELEGLYVDAVNGVNVSGKPVLAVDIPSGINALTGQVMGVAIRADITVSFVGLKLGLFLGDALNHVGDLRFADLGIDRELSADLLPAMLLCGSGDVQALLPPRKANAHKGHFGHVLAVGGNLGMGGAVRMSAEAALRSGAGLVSVATREANISAVLSGRPELMVRGVENAPELDALISRASVIALGPGLGRDEWAQQCFGRVLQSSCRKVLDADALNLLAEQPQRRNDWVLTPHPGEAGRLLGVPASDVQADRLGAVRELQSRYGGAVVLKGHGTLVAGEQSLPFVVKGGNPGMATAGMGDVLTGVIAGLMAQSSGLQLPAAVGAHIHACAGDLAAEVGQRGLVATDLLVHIRTLVNP